VQYRTITNYVLCYTFGYTFVLFIQEELPTIEDDNEREAKSLTEVVFKEFASFTEHFLDR
jgi:hypothetical protein